MAPVPTKIKASFSFALQALLMMARASSREWIVYLPDIDCNECEFAYNGIIASRM